MDMGYYYKINIHGIVQGVGFRPFLYNLAEKFKLTGSIINKGNVGVELLLYTLNKAILDEFLSAIRTENPPISYIERVEVHKLNPENFSNIELEEIRRELQIKPSESGIGPSVTSPPDVAICAECVEEMNNPSNKRYYQYPFIACARCGPRYTTITELPYDRERTTMNEFPFCTSKSPSRNSCLSEYLSPKNRRFHAQTFSCRDCGPNYFFLFNPELVSQSLKNEEDATHINEYLVNRSKTSLNAPSAIQIASEYILSGKIVAIMGIGGVHIVGDARNLNVIDLIRNRKRKRKTKPFAVMVKDINSAEKYAVISEEEKLELLSFRRPIVLLKKKKEILPESIAPGLHNIGIMLPYAGIHHLLFQLVGDIPLIFTSGNFSDLPMAISPEEVVRQLNQLADGYLLHNRVIFQRADDSVLRMYKNHVKIIRRSRGYVPEYFALPFEPTIKGGFAVGPELNSTGLVARGHRLFPTQHIGNVDTLETYEFLHSAILHLKSLLKLNNSDIEFIAMDLHPQFQSTKLAKTLQKEFEIPYAFPVQHHFAHAASLMVDNKIKKNIPAVIATLDGVGYGNDGNVWGGEIIRGTYDSMERIHHLSYIPMVGGDLCVTYPSRMATGYLLKLYEQNHAIELAGELCIKDGLIGGDKELESLISSYSLKENVAYTSSCGRLIDSISCLLRVCYKKEYRGEPAMRLEAFAQNGNPMKYDFSSEIIQYIENHPNKSGIPGEKIIEDIILLLNSSRIDKNEFPNIAASSLYSIGKIFGHVCFQECLKQNLQYIGLSGGVAYNDFVSDGFYNTVRNLNQKNSKNITSLHHNSIPPGDAGISTGQAGIAISKIS